MSFAKNAGFVGLPTADRYGQFGHFDVLALGAALPPDQDSVVADHYLTNRNSASSRVIRVLSAVPAHYHETCDEYVYVLQGSGIVWLDDARQQAPFRAGHLLFFAQRVLHCLPKIFEGPVIAFSVDVPRRRADDVVYVDEQGHPTSPDISQAWSCF